MRALPSERRRASRRMAWLLHGGAAAIVLVAVYFLLRPRTAPPAAPPATPPAARDSPSRAPPMATPAAPQASFAAQIAQTPTFLVDLPGCPYCARAKELLAKRGVKYALLPKAESAALIADIAQRFNHRTFPMIAYAGKFIGGCDRLMELDAAQGLK